METEREILAKLQGLEEQVEILTRLLIAFIISDLFQGQRFRLLTLKEQINEIVFEKGTSINLMRILNALD